MKKAISTIVAIGIISTVLVNTSYAGDRGGINPLWIPVAIISTVAAMTIARPEPVDYERRVRSEPRQQYAIREEPRHYRHAHYGDSDRAYEGPRHRSEYR
jgi:hypothetical protein